MKKEPQYSYALDENKHLIHIDNAIGKDKNVKYICPHCRREMIPKQGMKKRWHFAHKENLDNCSYESYLHKLAKTKIRELFESNLRFNIRLPRKVVCCTTECPIGQTQLCHREETVCLDIKKYYNICKEEGLIDDFRADILLTNEANYKPILIEIFVTHKSTEKKTHSNHRIIEIKIENEEDIEYIASSYFGQNYNENEAWHLNGKIAIFNFQLKERKEDNGKCPYESYLHKLTKIRIREYFKSNSSFNIRLPQKYVCCATKCHIGQTQLCHRTETICLDIKKYYNICKEDILIDGFRADILLTNETNCKPILIEIFVTHKSTEKKICSNHRIIEIKIENEDDIDHIIDSYFGQHFNKNEAWHLNGKIEVFNFQLEKRKEAPAKELQKDKFIFFIKPNGIFKFESKPLKCLDSIDEEFLLLFESPIKINRERARLIMVQNNIKNCLICHHFLLNTKPCSEYRRNGGSPVNCPYFKKEITILNMNHKFTNDLNQAVKITIPPNYSNQNQ